MESIFQHLQLRMPCECSPHSSDYLTLKDCGKFLIRLSRFSVINTRENQANCSNDEYRKSEARKEHFLTEQNVLDIYFE